MSMRISTNHAFEVSLSSLQRRQAQLSDTQERLTSGKRVQKASDDPANAARAERARGMQSAAEAQLRALDTSRNAMTLSEGALGNAVEILQQARELVINAGDGSFGDQDRLALAEQLRSLRNDLMGVANRNDGSGRYLFGGQGSGGPPMRDTPAGVVYDGTPGQLNAAAGTTTPLALDGQAAFLRAPDPANPGGTLSTFDVLDRAITELSTPGRSSAQIAQTVTDSLGQIDVVSENVSSWRARAGEALNRIDAIEGRLSQSKLDAQSERSDAEDLDMVSAISEFQSRQTGYDAALKTYSMVQRMTLFDYLK